MLIAGLMLQYLLQLVTHDLPGANGPVTCRIGCVTHRCA